MTIKGICREYGIKNYTINEDGTIDVNGNVDLSGYRLVKLPLIFGKVSGIFNCSNNNLTSLVGCPKEVGRDFDCSDNKLTSLEHCPKKVGGGFDCCRNQLTSLEYCPNSLGYSFFCSKNKLTSLEHCPKNVDGNFYCSYNKITDLNGLGKFEGKFHCLYNPIGSILRDEVESGITYAFQVYKVIKGTEVNINRLKYLSSLWNLRFNLSKIKRHYTIV